MMVFYASLHRPPSGIEAHRLRCAALLSLTAMLAAGCGEAAARVSVSSDAEPTAEEPQVPDEADETPGDAPDETPAAVRSRARELLGPARYGGFWAENGTFVVAVADEVSDAEREQLRLVADGRRLRLERVTYALAELERLAAELETHPDLGELSISIHEPDNVVVAQAEDVDHAAALLEPWSNGGPGRRDSVGAWPRRAGTAERAVTAPSGAGRPRQIGHGSGLQCSEFRVPADFA